MDKKINKKNLVISTTIFITILIIYYVYSKNTISVTKTVTSKKDFTQNATIEVPKKNIEESLSNNLKDGNYLIEGNFLNDNIVTEEELKAMEHNTKVLQLLVDSAEENEVITIEKGVYYFTKGGSNTKGNEDYIIKLSNNVNIT